MDQYFLSALLENPKDELVWSIYADWLQEQDDPAGTILGIRHLLTRSIEVDRRAELEATLIELLSHSSELNFPEVTNQLEMAFVLIPPGEFLMGSPVQEINRDESEKQHRVQITEPFFIGKYLVTQSHYEQVMNVNPAAYSLGGEGEVEVWDLDTKDFPVESVSWDKAMDFCNRLSLLEQKQYRLPSEAEWEYACRAGTTSAFHFGDRLNRLRANVDCHDAMPRPTSVGSYEANAFNLFDMHGNVWEWCHDWYRSDAYFEEDQINPSGPPDGLRKVMRGGSWANRIADCRSASRGRDHPVTADAFVGFRVVLNMS